MAEEMNIKCRIIVPRLTIPEKAKEQDEIANALNQISEEDIRKVDRGLKKLMVKKGEPEKRGNGISEKLENYRKKWEEKMDFWWLYKK